MLEHIRLLDNTTIINTPRPGRNQQRICKHCLKHRNLTEIQTYFGKKFRISSELNLYGQLLIEKKNMSIFSPLLIFLAWRLEGSFRRTLKFKLYLPKLLNSALV